MDYGYQLLRHVVQQVFGNLGSAARITLPLLALPLIIMIVTNPELLTTMTQPVDPTAPPVPVENVDWLGVVLVVITGIIGWLWAAVAWHRFVLLEEYPGGVLPAFRPGRIGGYLVASFVILLIAIVVGIAMGLAVGIVIAFLQNMAVGFVLGIGLVFGITWVVTRLGLILPAAAIGEPLKVSESWAATAPVSGQIMLPIIVIALVSGLASQLVAVALGQGLAAIVVMALVSWLQFLVNLALMTTLYGNLVEGRQLN